MPDMRENGGEPTTHRKLWHRVHGSRRSFQSWRSRQGMPEEGESSGRKDHFVRRQALVNLSGIVSPGRSIVVRVSPMCRDGCNGSLRTGAVNSVDTVNKLFVVAMIKF